MAVERKIDVLSRSESLCLAARYMGMPIVAAGIDLNIIPDKVKYWAQGSERDSRDLPMFKTDYRATEAGLVLSKNHLLEMSIVDEREGLLRQAEERYLLNDEQLMTIRQIELPIEQRQELESIGGRIETAIQIRMSREKDWVGNQYFQDLIYVVMAEAVGEEGFKIKNFTKTLEDESLLNDDFLVLPKEKLSLIDKALVAAGLDLNKQPGVVESYQKLFAKRKGEYQQQLVMVDGEMVLMLIDSDQRLIWGGTVVNEEGLDNFLKTQNELGKLMVAGGGSYQELISFSNGGLSQNTSSDKEEQIIQVTKVDADGAVKTVFKYLSPEDRFNPRNFKTDRRFIKMTKVMLLGLTEGIREIDKGWLMVDGKTRLGPWWLFEDIEQRTIEEFSGENEKTERDFIGGYQSKPDQPISQRKRLMINTSEMAFVSKEQIKTNQSEGGKKNQGNEVVDFADFNISEIIYQADENSGVKENSDTNRDETENDGWDGDSPDNDGNPELPSGGGLSYKRSNQDNNISTQKKGASLIEANYTNRTKTNSNNEIKASLTGVASIKSIDKTNELVDKVDIRESSSKKEKETNFQGVTVVVESGKPEKGRLRKEKNTESLLLVESQGIKTIPIRNWREFLRRIQLMGKDYPEFDLSSWLQIPGIELNVPVEPLLNNVKNNVEGAETALAIKKIEKFVFFADRAGVAMATLLIFASNNPEPVKVKKEQILYGQGRGLQAIQRRT